MPQRFDLVIVGTGSGNSLVTPELDDRRIAIVEEGVFGGTCINVGCVPTKMFVYPADLADNAAHSARLGLVPHRLEADWPAMRDRIFGRIDPISVGGRAYRKSGTHNVTLFETHAEFCGPRTLRLGTGETLTADTSCSPPDRVRSRRPWSHGPASGTTRRTRSCGSTSCRNAS